MQNNVQPQLIKLFDHKFVANVLKNHHHCPKCHYEFSHWYDVQDKYSKDVTVRSNRPILLPCGHNLCENCIVNNRQTLMCNICLNPIELPTENNGQLQNFQFRDHFNMNFYLLGELTNLRYYNKDNSANSTLLATTQIDNNKKGTIHCSECELVPALGKCRQCKQYYCRRCFDEIHKCGKTLKMHKLQVLDNRIKSKETERFLKPGFCKYHKKPHDRFCPKCDCTCCPECAKHDHKQHGWKTIIDENKRHKDGISTILQNVNSFRSDVKRALKVSALNHFANRYLAKKKIAC